MGSTPNYASTPHNEVALLTAASVGYGPTAPTNLVAGFTAVAAGSKIDKVVCQITGQITATVVNVFIFDGTNYWLIDQYSLPALTQAATVPFPTVETPYDRLTLVGGLTPEKLYYGATVTPTSGDIIISTIGGDF